MNTHILHIPFHPYGFILGCAATVGIYLSEKKAKEYHFSEKLFWQLMMVGLLAGIIGARLWHVMTDFSLYQSNLLQVFFVWNGGLSIIGGVLGGILGVGGYVAYKKIATRQLILFCDLCIFGLPFAQAVGRLGNWINHELYGLPTSLPWAMFIPPAYRIAGFERFSYFHPLFAYEAICMLVLGSSIWWLDATHKKWLAVGSGKTVLIYLVYYSCIRFLLDFLRIDKATINHGMIGFNQVALVGIGLISSYMLVKIVRKKSP